jgi:hypothetical protein
MIWCHIIANGWTWVKGEDKNDNSPTVGDYANIFSGKYIMRDMPTFFRQI